ncbi:hypothetical protein LRS04_11920 [Phenylobacterium sp. J367]|nr:hypothetical protein [Phenylobacterium sp. J367]MCR5878981.1 hypothetical protein [Phenylobacterium sp. J367]
MHADRRAQRLVEDGFVGLEAVGGLVRIEAQRAGVGADIADGEGPGRQLLQPHVLDGREVGAADARAFGQFLERQPLEIADEAQRVANVRAGMDGGGVGVGKTRTAAVRGFH